MTFHQPLLLFALMFIVLLAGMYVVAQGRRRAYTMRFTNLALLSSVVARNPGVRRHLPPFFFLLGAAGLVFAAAGPVLNLEVQRHDASVMLVIDVSGSMDATDVQPSRIEAAKNAARNMVRQLPSGDRIGLVSFNGYATVAAPMSDNRDLVLGAIDGLRAGGATAIGDALQLAVEQLKPTLGPPVKGPRPPAMVILLTDGVSNRGITPAEAAAQAKQAGVIVHTVGIGSRNAGIVVHGQDVGGVDEQGLSQVAAVTGGKYYFAEAAGQLKDIYATLGSQFAWRPFAFDLTVPLVALGTLLVLSGAALSLWWFRVLP
jgi:Ca-activated chloride channel family protein